VDLPEILPLIASSIYSNPVRSALLNAGRISVKGLNHARINKTVQLFKGAMVTDTIKYSILRGIRWFLIAFYIAALVWTYTLIRWPGLNPESLLIALSFVFIGATLGFGLNYSTDRGDLDDTILVELKEIVALIVGPYLLSLPIDQLVIPFIPWRPLIGISWDPTGTHMFFFVLALPQFIGFVMTYFGYCLYREEIKGEVKRIAGLAT
jgi:hypothetical protein